MGENLSRALIEQDIERLVPAIAPDIGPANSDADAIRGQAHVCHFQGKSAPARAPFQQVDELTLREVDDAFFDMVQGVQAAPCCTASPAALGAAEPGEQLRDRAG